MSHMKRLSSGDSDKREKHSQQQSKIARRRKIMVALWYRASQYLGPQFEAQFGTIEDDTIYAWQEGLRHLSEEQIAVGVDALSRWSERYPPTLGQFRQLCTANDTARSNQHAALTHSPDREKVAAAKFRELQRIAQLRLDENPETREESLRNLGLDKEYR